jgi:hypothetical protein
VTCGLTDVISHDPVRLNQIVQQISKNSGTIITKPEYQIAGSPTAQAVMDVGDLQDSPTILNNFAEELLPNEPLQVAPIHQEKNISCRVMLAAIEEIVSVSNNYFGPLAQGNYWRKSHAQIIDEFPFITNWSADHFSKITCQESILERGLTVEDIHSLQVWVDLFIKECERIIVDFRSILNNSNLSLSAKNLLIIP